MIHTYNRNAPMKERYRHQQRLNKAEEKTMPEKRTKQHRHPPSSTASTTFSTCGCPGSCSLARAAISCRGSCAVTSIHARTNARTHAYHAQAETTTKKERSIGHRHRQVHVQPSGEGRYLVPGRFFVIISYARTHARIYHAKRKRRRRRRRRQKKKRGKSVIVTDRYA